MAQMTSRASCWWAHGSRTTVSLRADNSRKTRIALGLGLAACQRGLTMGLTDNRYFGSLDLAGLMLDLGCD